MLTKSHLRTVVFYGLILPVLALLYGGLMLVYHRGWQKAAFVTPLRSRQNTFSVIIPARNEAANIGACLDAILAQDYPAALIEIVVIDDHSEDDTAAIVKRYADHKVRCISLHDYMQSDETIVAYKKKALSAGIAASKGEIIVTTDADCIAGTGWIPALNAGFANEATMLVAAPVDFSSDGSLLQEFQSLDFMTMQGITAAAHAMNLGGMANGANLAFRRNAFDAVSGYSGTEHLASGDDFLLLAKMQARFPQQTVYLKNSEAIVSTAPQPDWPSFLQQRIRWASKNGKYKDHRLTAVLMLVYAFNAALLAATVSLILTPRYWPVVAGIWGWKVCQELFFLFPVARFFSKQKSLWIFPVLQPLHVGYVFLAGFLGMVGKFEWKGRVVR